MPQHGIEEEAPEYGGAPDGDAQGSEDFEDEDFEDEDVPDHLYRGEEA